MEKIINCVTGVILVGFACLLAAALSMNAVQALAGKASFAYWHWVTLFILIYFCRKAVPWVTFARMAVRIRQTRRRAVKFLLNKNPFSNITRAAHGLAALFCRDSKQWTELS